MNKIICDICGTTYPDSSECCPICGCSSTTAAALLGSNVQYDDSLEETNVRTANHSETGRKKEIFDFDEVNTEDASDDEDEEAVYDEEEEEEEEDPPRHNTFAVILLTVLIVVLLGAAAFIYFRYFLPNRNAEDVLPATELIQETETTGPTTEPTVPCAQMGMLSASVAELSAEGQQFLLHVKAFPENTTDKIIYTSADESIATVTEDGKITAVSEGETTIYISCGKVSMDCPVIVKYVEETVPPTTEAVVEETVPVEEPTDPQEDPGMKTVTLKLKKTDIQLGVYYTFQLELDCELTPEEVTWSSEHPYIATVDEKGNVTAVKEGTTSITAKYGDQAVQCIVRCIWY